MTTPIQKPILMALIREHADIRGWVDALPSDLAKLSGIPPHEVVHALWDLQKLGYVRFRERHLGGANASELSRIRLTSLGRIAASTDGPIEQVIATGSYKARRAFHERQADAARTSPEEPTVIALPAPTAPTLVAPAARLPEPSLADFPLIRALSERRAKVEQAAQLLEEAGEDELALAAIERARAAYSPLEEEVLRLLEQTTLIP